MRRRRAHSLIRVKKMKRKTNRICFFFFFSNADTERERHLNVRWKDEALLRKQHLALVTGDWVKHKSRGNIHMSDMNSVDLRQFNMLCFTERIRDIKISEFFFSPFYFSFRFAGKNKNPSLHNSIYFLSWVKKSGMHVISIGSSVFTS